MTTVVILLLGFGAILIVSAIESNPDGSDVSVLQTISDVWNDKLNFTQGNTNNSTNSGTPPAPPAPPAPPSSTGGGGGGGGTKKTAQQAPVGWGPTTIADQRAISYAVQMQTYGMTHNT